MDERNELIGRLKKVEGQIRGIQKMIQEERECSDIIRQVVAASRALDKVGYMITSRSLRKCVARTVQTGEDPGPVLEDAVEMLFAAAKSGR
jgi:DNA-binding FrmR family transcriptional regulator